MPKRPPPTRRLEGRTDDPSFASRIRTAQSPGGPTAALKGMAALMPGGTMLGAMRPEVMKRKGGRGR
jgi:hypothetical protein